MRDQSTQSFDHWIHEPNTRARGKAIENSRFFITLLEVVESICPRSATLRNTELTVTGLMSSRANLHHSDVAIHGRSIPAHSISSVQFKRG